MRRQSREVALQVLFQLEFSPQINMADFLDLFEHNFNKETLGYAQELVQGVRDNLEKADQKIQSVSQHWKIQRMAIIDRNILRLAIFEICYSANPIAPGIVINEAIELAKKYGSTESSSFINGILDQIAKG